MDAVCLPTNWDVWLYEQGGTIVAAMPYYVEERAAGTYITKAPLTQNNGIIFKHPEGAGSIAKAAFEEKVIDAACTFIASKGIAVYEQQYQYSFTNWLPFRWNGYDALPRYTYVIEDTADMDDAFSRISSNRRNVIRKGARNTSEITELAPEEFYSLHEAIFAKQGLPCPFSNELWSRLYSACTSHGSCSAFGALDDNDTVTSLAFDVWDEESVYHILGGAIPKYRRSDTYSYLIWKGIENAHDRGLSYDFEGSVIKRISKANREFGGTPKLYFRIRKVFSPQVITMESDQKLQALEENHAV
jgi:hypothetical protein